MTDFRDSEKLLHPETNKAFIFWVLLAYSIVEITGIIFHPMWRDEIHFWSISGESSSLSDLLQRKAWDGHPDLWYLLAFTIRRLSDDPVSLQLLHSAIAIFTVFLILKYAPFKRIHRVLLVFGYFYLFEYATIIRNYAIGILLITLILILYRRRFRSFFLLALVLFFLAQTNIFGLIFCIVFLLTWTFEFFYSRSIRTALLKRKTVLVAGFLLIITGMAYAVHSVIPPSVTPAVGVMDFSLSQLTLRELIRSFGTLWRAWIPIPVLNLQFWNTNLIGNEPVQAILALILIFAAGVLFIKRPVVLFLYVTGLVGIIAFIFIIFFGYLRHHGHLYILLIACIWLKAYSPERDIVIRPGLLEKFYGWQKRNAGHLFSILLIIHVLVGIYAYSVQLMVPFSAGKETARYIRQQKLDRFLIAGDKDISLETVSSYLDKKVFFFSRNQFSIYMDYDPSQRRILTESGVLNLADSLLKSSGDTMVLVMNYSLKTNQGLNVRKVHSFEKIIVPDDGYYLYFLSPIENQ